MLSSKFALVPDEKIRRSLQQIGQQVIEMSVQDLDAALPFPLVFESGLFVYSQKDQPIQIDRVVLRPMGTLVSVPGSDDQAWRVVGGIYEEVFKLAGIKKAFSDELVHAQNTATASIAKLNFGISEIFSPGLKSALADTIQSDSPVFKRVGSMRRSEQSNSDLEKYRIVAKLKQLEISVHRIDLEAGYSDECRLLISPRTKSDVAFGEYVVSSEYDNATHLQLVEALKKRLGSK